MEIALFDTISLEAIASLAEKLEKIRLQASPFVIVTSNYVVTTSKSLPVLPTQE